jgi:hypothetical protein
MTLFPNGGYSRVTHYNDVVPHIPIDTLGFKHAGYEEWYYDETTGLENKEC